MTCHDMTHLQMSQNTGVARTRVVAIIFVNTKLETFGVNIISYGFDSTWKPGPIWLEVASPDNKTLKLGKRFSYKVQHSNSTSTM